MATDTGTSANYPSGFRSGVTIQNLPILNTYGKKLWWVDSAASRRGLGTFEVPFANIAAAQSSAAVGDVVMIKSSHAETIATAGGLTLSTAGVFYMGLGSGNERPLLTFSTTASSVVISGANVMLSNIIGTPSVDSVTGPFDVQAAGVSLDVEWQDASQTIEAVSAVIANASADNLRVKLKYNGFIAGNACVRAIDLTGVNGARIDVDFYGIASTAVVGFTTTACTDVLVTGYAYNSTDTTGAKLVVDTIGSSTWAADIMAGAAGARFSGGSAAAIASDDVTAVNTVLGTVATAAATGAVSATDNLVAYIKQLVTQNGIEADTDPISAVLSGAGGITTWKSGAAPNTGVSMSEVIRYISENLGAVDTAAATGAVTATDNIMAYLKQLVTQNGVELDTDTLGDILYGASGIATFPAAAAPDNAVSLAAALRYVSEKQTTRSVSKAYANLAGYDTAAAFTVTGDVKVRVFGVVGATAITSTSGTTTLSVGTTENAGGIIAATTVDNSDFAITDVWVDNDPTTDCETLATAWTVIGGGADIVLTCNVDDIVGGTLTLYCEWMPLSSDGAVVAA